MSRLPPTIQKQFFSSARSPWRPRPNMARSSDRTLRFAHLATGKGISAKRSLMGAVIATNIVVFGAWQYGIGRPPFNEVPSQDRRPVLRVLKEQFLLSWENVRQGRFMPLIGSAFSHITLGHIALNMFALHSLSQVLVYTPGISALRIGGLIAGSAVSGSAAWLYEHKDDDKKPYEKHSALGASGIVTGFTGAVACLAPRMKSYVYGIIPMPLWGFGVLTVLIDTYFLGGQTGIGHSAHLGGAAFGVAYYFLALRRFGFGLRRL